MMQPYRDFSAMVVDTHKGKDWELFIKDPGGSALIVAIHGGGIEPLTSQLATAIAGDDLNLYDLRGIRESGNEQMRIPMIRFSEMRLDFLMRNCRTAVHIEGSRDEGHALVLGGANARLLSDLRNALAAAGFDLQDPPSEALLSNSQRFYNQCPMGGVQIEVPVGLRSAMISGGLSDPSYQSVAQRTERFSAFVAAVRAALDEHLAIMRSDLDATLAQFEKSTDQFPIRLRQQPQPGGRASHDHEHGDSASSLEEDALATD